MLSPCCKSAHLIGIGDVAQHHFRALSSPGNSFRLEGICDLNSDRVRNVLKHHLPDADGNIQGFSGDLAAEQLFDHISRNGSVDGRNVSVTIATPHGSHFELSRRAVDAGSSILVEKPAVTDLQQLAELRELLERSPDVRWNVALHWLHSPETRWVRRFLRTEHDAPAAVSFYVQGVSPLVSPEDSARAWMCKKAGHGGVLFDFLPNMRSDLIAFQPKIAEAGAASFEFIEAESRLFHRPPASLPLEDGVDDSFRLVFRVPLAQFGAPDVRVDLNATWQEETAGQRPVCEGYVCVKTQKGHTLVINHTNGTGFLRRSEEDGVAREVEELRAMKYHEHEAVCYRTIYAEHQRDLNRLTGAASRQAAVFAQAADDLYMAKTAAMEFPPVKNANFFLDPGVMATRSMIYRSIGNQFPA